LFYLHWVVLWRRDRRRVQREVGHTGLAREIGRVVGRRHNRNNGNLRPWFCLLEREFTSDVKLRIYGNLVDTVMKKQGTTYPLAAVWGVTIEFVLSKVWRELSPVECQRTRRGQSWIGKHGWTRMDIGLSYICCTLVTVKSKESSRREGIGKVEI
jgi:hypothetical protein